MRCEYCGNTYITHMGGDIWYCPLCREQVQGEPAEDVRICPACGRSDFHFTFGSGDEQIVCKCGEVIKDSHRLTD